MDAGADINPDNHEIDYGGTPLDLAARLGNVEMTKYLLERMKKEKILPRGELRAMLRSRTDVPFPKPIPEHRKQEAADCLTIVKMLLEAGEKPDAVHEATATNHTEIIKLLLDAGGDPNQANPFLSWEEGRTALNEAACHANLEVVNALISRGAKPSAATNAIRRQPIHYAILPGTVSLGNQNPWNAGDEHRLEIVEALLNAGADHKALASNNWTPLHSAVSAGNPEIVELLLKLGADANATTKPGLRPLHMSGFPHSVAIARILVKHGADINAVHRNGNISPIRFAIIRGEIDLVSYFLDQDLDNDSTNISYLTTLVRGAISSGQVEMVKFLVKRGAKIDEATPKTKKSSLHLAAGNGWLKMVRFLLDQGADPSALDSRGRTPHSWALAREQLTCASELEKYEPKPDLTTSPKR